MRNTSAEPTRRIALYSEEKATTSTFPTGMIDPDTFIHNPPRKNRRLLPLGMGIVAACMGTVITTLWLLLRK